MKKSFLALVAAVVSAIAAPATATQLVTNGGFESGTFEGWTQFGGRGETNVNAADAISGSFGARFSPNALGGIFQTITTVAGQSYDFSFDLQHRANLLAPNNSFSASFDGVTIFSLASVGNTGPNSFTFSAIASSTSAIIRFTFRDNRASPANRYSLDNVSLSATPDEPLPEPASWAMLFTGFALVGGNLRRRRDAMRVHTPF